MGNQRSSPAPSSLSYALPRLHQLCTPAPNENAAKVVVKFCYDFFLLPFAIRHSTFVAFSNTFRMCCLLQAERRGGEPSTRRIRMQMSMTGLGGGSFLSYFLLVFKVVKIDGPSAAVPAPPPAPAPAPALAFPLPTAVLRAWLT